MTMNDYLKELIENCQKAEIKDGFKQLYSFYKELREAGFNVIEALFFMAIQIKFSDQEED